MVYYNTYLLYSLTRKFLNCLPKWLHIPKNCTRKNFKIKNCDRDCVHSIYKVNIRMTMI